MKGISKAERACRQWSSRGRLLEETKRTRERSLKTVKKCEEVGGEHEIPSEMIHFLRATDKESKSEGMIPQMPPKKLPAVEGCQRC